MPAPTDQEPPAPPADASKPELLALVTPAAPAPAPAPARPRRKPPVLLTTALAAGLLVGVFGDFWASSYVHSLTAHAAGAIVHASARVSGEIATVKVEEGFVVKPGQVIAVLDDGDVRAALAQAEAQLVGARARLAAAQAGVTLQGAQTAMNVATARSTLQAARATLASAEATVGQTRGAHARLRTLRDGGYVSGEEVEAARTLMLKARADADAARAAVRGAEEGVRHAQASTGEEVVRRDGVAAAKADIAQFEAAIALARVRLGETAIKAPIGGVVVRRLAQPGEQVDKGEAVLAIVDPARIWVTATVDELQAHRVRPGAAATVRFDAWPGRRFPGKVAFISATTDEATSLGSPPPLAPTVRTPSRVTLRVQLDQPDPELRPGLSATVRIDAAR